MYKITLLFLTFFLTVNSYTQEKPTAENTGYTGELTEYTGRTSIVADNTIIENKLILGTINIYADNVTIRNCKISNAGIYGVNTRDGKNILIEDCEIEGMSSAAIIGSNFTARRCNIWNTGSDGIKPISNFTIEACYFHHLGYLPEAHADGIQMVSGGNGVITGNNFDMGPAEGYKNSQVIIIQTNNGLIDNVAISNNWINGGGFSIQIRDREEDFGFPLPTNITITDNLFGPDAQFGNIAIDGDVAETKNFISGNKFEDTNEAIPENNTSSTLSTNSIEENFNEFLSYPNPVIEDLYILDSNNATYQIFSNSALLLRDGYITSNKFIVKMNTLSAGFYYIRIITPEGLSSRIKKIVKL